MNYSLQDLQDPRKKHKVFSAIVAQYSEKLYWTVRRIVGRHEDADDVLQNTFVKAWTKIDNFRGDSGIYTWLHRICVNESLDFLRKKHEFLSTDTTIDVVNTIEADDYFDGNETQELLFKAIETLPEAQKATFTLRYFDELPYAEISKIMGTSEGGLKANYHLAVRKIKEFFNNNS